MYRNSREARKMRETQKGQEHQEYQEHQRQSEGVGIIEPNHHPITDFIPTHCLLQFQYIIQKTNMQEKQLTILTHPINLMLILHHIQYTIQ